MKYFLLIISLIAILGGSQGIYTSVKNPNPTIYNLDSLSTSDTPDKEWITLKNCDINLLNAAYFENTFGNGLAKEIYIPLRSSNNDSVIALLATKNKNTLDVYNLINSQTDEQKAIEFTEKYKDQVFQENIELSGTVRFGIELDNREHRRLKKISEYIVNDYIIIDYNKKPQKGLYYFIIIIGIVLLLISIIKLRKHNSKNIIK